jgi:hypothetical protein
MWRSGFRNLVPLLTGDNSESRLASSPNLVCPQPDTVTTLTRDRHLNRMTLQSSGERTADPVGKSRFLRPEDIELKSR